MAQFSLNPSLGGGGGGGGSLKFGVSQHGFEDDLRVEDDFSSL